MMITGPMMTGLTYGASSKKPGTSSSSSGSHVKKPGVGGSVKPTHPSVGGTLTIPGRPLLQDERYFLL
jgi:hypothetical protein